MLNVIEDQNCICEIKNLTKHYGKFKALDDINLKIGKGKIIGLLGKNGAGKSTLMRSMLSFLKYQGEVIYPDIPRVEPIKESIWSWLFLGPALVGIFNALKRADNDARSRLFNDVAFIPDVSGLDDRLTVQQTMDYVRGVNPRWNEATAAKLFAISNLPLNKKVGKLSKGMKTKLYLLITLSLDVRYLLLDEPTLGLDIAFRKEFFNTILGEFFDENKTILISTHQVEEVEDLLQEIVFIDNGKILLHEDVDSLKARFRVVSLPVDRASEIYEHRPKVTAKTLGFVSAVLDSSISIEGATYGRANLADIFLAVVGGSHETV